MAEVRTRNRAPAQFGGLLFKTPLVGDTGSLLIRRGGAVLGAIGVSGASPEQESDCAAAGLASFSR
jgi:glc operon protein GlcG